MHKVAGSNPAGNKHIFRHLSVFLLLLTLMTHIEEVGSYGVMVSTLDFESSDPSSNLDRTSHNLTPWRNGSASDSRSEGCVFESRRGHKLFSLIIFFEKKMFASNEDWTHDLWFTRPTLCHWAIEAFLISIMKILIMLNNIVRVYKCLLLNGLDCLPVWMYRSTIQVTYLNQGSMV